MTSMTHPLAGQRVAITRPAAQSRALIAGLRATGAIPIAFPTIRIAPLEDYAACDDALRRLAAYDWVVFTSVNGVRVALERMKELGLDPVQLNECHVAAIGPATAARLRAYDVEVSLRPDEYVAEAIVVALLERGPFDGLRFLLLRADIAREALREHLVAHGATVDEVPVYRTALGEPGPQEYAEMRAGVDVITFTSSSTVRNFVELLRDEAPAIAGRARIACIGPITARTARELGLRVDVVAAEYTVPGLLAALADTLRT